ncbi:glutathione peroxidase [Campylobacter californiensis]|uniref:glutathione peroxidase n=1 Tax=Campylobacter californiensis TaxID=1032243 RepID=UPI001474103D|nr:redoxin domain-containing protein [Campylobacter sp. RM12916]MBE3610017.1 redoxin domain-containing protein [Campylobacter sp. RM12916]
MKIYDINVTTNRGESKSMSEYKGKVLLIANTASKCGFTGQYTELEKLNAEFKDKGFCVLGFPSDNFANQEPDDDENIAKNCQLNFGVTFELLKKGDVRGENAAEIFKFLTSKQGFKGFDKEHPLSAKVSETLEKNFPEILKGDGVKWNFTKFLVDKNGEVVARFEPTASFDKIKNSIENLLK